TVNLEKSLINYKEKLEGIKRELEARENRYKRMMQSGQYGEEKLKAQTLEIAKQKNLYDYGRDVILNTERTNLNQGVLKRKYYIIISHYYSAENEYLDKDEIKDYVFSDLYTKAQSIIRTLYSTGVSGRILDSQGLVDLLYNSYNRDEAENYGIEKAVAAGYDNLYSTAPDVFERRIKALDAEIENKAMQVAQEAVLKAKSDKELELEAKEEKLEDLINSLAKDLITENTQYIGNDVAKVAVKNIGKSAKQIKGDG
ncbi:MAG: hypothetical protein FWC68_04780, partial [Oscillospiraceae bacterium]|nr:hypothetical protein [Oscillospiraceae bacterium]